MHERLASRRARPLHPGRAARRADRAATRASAGPTPGGSRPGARADLVAVRLDTAAHRRRRPGPGRCCAATAADVDTVVVDGRVVVATGGTCSATSARCCRLRSTAREDTERPTADASRCVTGIARARSPPRSVVVTDRGPPADPARHAARRRGRRRRRHVAWVGPAAPAPAADRRIDVGGRAVVPGLRRLPHPPRVRRRPRRRVRRPDARRALRRRRDRLDRRRHPGRRRRRAARPARRPDRRAARARAPRPSRSRAATGSPSPTRSARCGWPPR